MTTTDKHLTRTPPRHAPATPDPQTDTGRAAAVISELVRRHAVPTRSRDEQAFIDLQRGCHQ